MKKWIFDPAVNSAILEEATEEIVMYINDVHEEVIVKLVEMWNEEYSTFKIRQYLESDNRVTPEEVDFLMETVELAIEEENKNPTIKETSPEYIAAVDPIKQNSEPVKEEYNVQIMEPITQIQVPQGAEVQQIEPPIKAPRGRKAVTSNTGAKRKAVSLEDMIQEMQSKIELAKVFQNLPEMPFPENLSKSGRDLMLGFQKEYKALIEKYIDEIQNL